MSCTPEQLSYIHQKHENPTTLVKKVMREFDRGTRGWFLRKVVLGHGGGGVQLIGAVNPLYTSSESVTTRRGRPGHL